MEGFVELCRASRLDERAGCKRGFWWGKREVFEKVVFEVGKVLFDREGAVEEEEGALGAIEGLPKVAEVVVGELLDVFGVAAGVDAVS